MSFENYSNISSDYIIRNKSVLMPAMSQISDPKIALNFN